MINIIYLLKPIPRYAIWGHTLLRDTFDFKDFPDGIGQSWSFSTQPKSSNIIIEGKPEFVGKSLLDLWNDNPEIFNSNKKHFPFIIGLVAPEDDLSIQVHPNTLVAKKHGLMSGKNEAWYFIDAEENSSIVFNHNANSKKQLISYIQQNKWNELLKYKSVQKSDFVYIPAGTLHAMKKGVITYEVQQATDVTYRFYDYERTDENNNQRELHIEKAIESINFNTNEKEQLPSVVHESDNITVTQYINNKYFCIRKLQITGETRFSTTEYECATVIRGNGTIENISVKAGDAFLIPARSNDLLINGHLDIMLTSEQKIQY